MNSTVLQAKKKKKDLTNAAAYLSLNVCLCNTLPQIILIKLLNFFPSCAVPRFEPPPSNLTTSSHC